MMSIFLCVSFAIVPVKQAENREAQITETGAANLLTGGVIFCIGTYTGLT
jgi:hypothetical protein